MKNVLITGATSGIGEATARYLCNNGYRVILLGRNAQKLDLMRKELGQNCEYIEYDLNDLENIHTIFEKLSEMSIKLDGLAHCAGIPGTNLPARNGQVEDYRKLMTVSFFALTELCKHFTNRKYSVDGAAIVAMSSLAIKTCYKGTSAYTTAKQAVATFCHTVAKETLKRRIRINAIAPAYVNTPMVDAAAIDFAAEQPLGLIEPVEIAMLMEYLLSDRAKSITGAVIPVSAGMNY